MIDFIKSLNIDIKIDELLDNKNLEFKTYVSERTGEINKNRFIAEYKNLTFQIVNNQYVSLSGSIHKFNNKGVHNYNDFNLYDLFRAIKELYVKFKINPFLTPLNNIEFAVNIIVPFKPKTFIKTNVISHKGTPASIKTFKGNGYLKEFEHSQYYIKVYDKGMPFNRPDNIFRFEIKVIKMEYLQKIGIKTLADLLNTEKLQNLGNKLNSVFNELLIIDKANTKNFTLKEKEIYQNGINPMFWERLKPHSKENDYIRLRSKYNRENEKFKNLINKYNLNKTQRELSKLITTKWNDLLKIDMEKRYKLTTFLNECFQRKTVQIDQYFTNEKKTETVQIDTSNIASNCTDNIKKCKVTNLDISMQKENSIFLCVSGIEFYQIYFPEIYRELEKRLSKKWRNITIDKRNIEIAHSIRNEHFNKIHNIKRSIKKITSYPSIFNNFDLIDKRKLEIAGLI